MHRTFSSHLSTSAAANRVRGLTALLLTQGSHQDFPGTLSSETAEALAVMSVEVASLRGTSQSLQLLTGGASTFRSDQQAEGVALSMVLPFRDAPDPLLVVLPTGGTHFNEMVMMTFGRS